jgi:hypothetical protein
MRPALLLRLLCASLLVIPLACGSGLDTSVGARAPEISASDLAGVPFKLSDYRGKVVLLDFWGLW